MDKIKKWMMDNRIVTVLLLIGFGFAVISALESM